jgi:hypothetical protein
MHRNKRKILIAGLLTIAIIVLFLILLSVFHKKQWKSDNPIFAALPAHAVFIYAGEYPSSVLTAVSEKGLWYNLINTNTVQDIHKELSLIDSIIANNPFLSEYAGKSQCVISLHKTSAKTAEALMLVQGPPTIHINDIRDNLKPYFKGRLSVRKFMDHEIHDILIKTNQTQFAYSMIDNILAFSSNSLLIEDAIRAFASSSGKQIFLQEITAKTLSKNQWTINFGLLNDFFRLFINNRAADAIRNWKLFSSYGVYELINKENYTAFHGNIYDTSEQWNALSIYKNQKAINTDIQDFIPSRAAFFSVYALSNTKLFFSNREKIIQRGEYSDSYSKKLEILQEEYNIPVGDKLRDLIRNQFALCMLEPVGEHPEQSLILFVKVRNTDEFGRELSKLEPGSQVQYQGKTSETKYKECIIKKLIESPLISTLFANLFNSFIAPYYTIYKDYIIFANDPDHLKSALDDIVSDQTMAFSSSYNAFSDKLVSDYNFLLWINPERCRQIPVLYVNEIYQNRLSAIHRALAAIDQLAFQIVGGTDVLYSQLLLSLGKKNAARAEKIWESSLEAFPAHKAFVVKNHNEPSKELLVFDDSNTMYLISNAGSVLWKRHLEEEPVGEVYQVDFYNNKKLQYLFTTRNKIQLIDRLGRNVANYPIGLSAATNTGLFCYDPEFNNKVQYFISCANKRLFAYSLSGKPLNGWNAKNLDDELQYPMKEFKSAGKQYFYGLSKKGTLYLWDFSGRPVFDPVPCNTSFVSNFRVHYSEPLSLFSADTQGVLYQFFPDRKMTKVSFPMHSPVTYFDLKDMNNDGKIDYLFFSSDSIFVFSGDSALIKSIALPAKALGEPGFITLENKEYISYINAENEYLYVIDKEGLSHPVFPLSSQVFYLFFDFRENGKKDLITANKNRIVMYEF